MSKCDIERNAEIAMMRKEGATLQEIAEWYEISPQRAMQISVRFSDGDTKEEIIKNWERKQAEKEERRMEDRLEYKRLADLRKEGREYVIMNGTENLYLTEIEQTGGHPLIYHYKSSDIHDALWFTLAEAKEIARKCRARAIWAPRIAVNK